MYPVPRSNAVPPQLPPPSPPGNTTALFNGAPSARKGQGVNGPELDTPPFFSTNSRQACACSAVVSAAVTRSSGLKLTRASAGGFNGNGCVGAVSSPGTSDFGTV